MAFMLDTIMGQNQGKNKRDNWLAAQGVLMLLELNSLASDLIWPVQDTCYQCPRNGSVSVAEIRLPETDA